MNPGKQPHNKDSWMEWFLPTTRHEQPPNSRPSSPISAPQDIVSIADLPVPHPPSASSAPVAQTAATSQHTPSMAIQRDEKEDPPSRSWRWSTWSDTLLRGSDRGQQQRRSKQRQPLPTRHPSLPPAPPSQYRQSYPPSNRRPTASRPSSTSSKRRSQYLPSHSNRQHHLEQQERRRSLSGIWTTFLSRTPSPSLTSSTASRRGGAGTNNLRDGSLSSSSNNTSTNGRRHQQQRYPPSRSSRGRSSILPLRSYHPSSGSSRRGSAGEGSHPTARSSLVLQFTDDDMASMYAPEIMFESGDEAPSHPGSFHFRQPPLLFPPHAHSSPALDPQQPLEPQEDRTSGWFSNWISSHPRRQKRRQPVASTSAATDDDLRRYSANSQRFSTYSHQSGSPSHPSQSSGGAGSGRHRRRRKVHPMIYEDPQGLDDYLLGEDAFLDGPHERGSSNNTSNKRDSGNSNTKSWKRVLPLAHYPTLSDLSSLTSTNPSETHLRATLPFEASAPASAIAPLPHLITSDKKQRLDLEEKKSKNKRASTSTRRQRRLRGHRFSVVWRSQSGKTGKRVVHVDEKGQIKNAFGPLAKWETCDHDTSGHILASLFLVGFVFCPCWWVGAYLYLTRRHHFYYDIQIIYLWTPRTFGQLNCCLAALSWVLIGLLIALVVWYHSVVA
ncbi:hypothetical protein DM01DRAFT_1226085 [Hesseltinella vesiculosa]|uniref:Uncharacterized protein n=1 Tax=Hesseltinella vesiculosa TaxID=101127 RepID=A0A1X2GMU5_9FUNG|nr:hypothetical protein DM01DRAFT_1226085 [Hesseltinella vesiculosa]